MDSMDMVAFAIGIGTARVLYMYLSFLDGSLIGTPLS